MSYTKTNWQTGDLITAEKLNHAEQGIYNNSTSTDILTVHIEIDEQTQLAVLDKTWEEVYGSSYTILVEENETQQKKEIIGFVTNTEYSVEDGGYIVVFNMLSGGSLTLVAQNSNDYPTEGNENSGEGGIS